MHTHHTDSMHTYLVDIRPDMGVGVELHAVSVVVPPTAIDPAAKHPPDSVVLAVVAALPAPESTHAAGERRVGRYIPDVFLLRDTAPLLCLMSPSTGTAATPRVRSERVGRAGGVLSCLTAALLTKNQECTLGTPCRLGSSWLPDKITLLSLDNREQQNGNTLLRPPKGETLKRKHKHETMSRFSLVYPYKHVRMSHSCSPRSQSSHTHFSSNSSSSPSSRHTVWKLRRHGPSQVTMSDMHAVSNCPQVAQIQSSAVLAAPPPSATNLLLAKRGTVDTTVRGVGERGEKKGGEESSC